MNQDPNEAAFERDADRTLRALAAALDAVEGLEADLESGILTLEFDDGTKYIINSHRAARQIWMAAERTAWHFDLSAASLEWKASKSGEELWAAVEGVLNRKLGRTLRLARS